MKSIKRFLATVLCLCLLAVCLPAIPVLAEDTTVTIEAESVATKGNSISGFTVEKKTGTGYSGDAYCNVYLNSATDVEVAVNFTLTVEKAGLYDVTFYAKPGSTRGIWAAYVGDTLIDTFDMYDSRPWQQVSVTAYSLGQLEFNSTSLTVKMVWVGNNEAISGDVHNLVADYFALTPVTFYESSVIEAETVGTYTGTQTGLDSHYRTGSGWSGGGFFFVNYGAGQKDVLPDISVTYTLTVDKVGVYGLSLTAKTGNGRGLWDVYVDDVLIDTLDMHHASGEMTDFSLGDITFQSTTVTLKMVCVGMSDSSTIYKYGLAADCFTLTSKSVKEAAKYEAETYHKSGATVSTGRTDGSSNNGLCVVTGGDKIGTTVSYELTGVPAGTYTLSITTKNDTSRGIYSVSTGNTLIGSVDMKGSANTFVTTELGKVTVSGGSLPLTMVCTGNSTGSNRYTYAVDYFTLSPVMETAEDMVGSVTAVGRGYLDTVINGDAATITAEAAISGGKPRFLGWTVNGVWQTANDTATLTVKADASQNVVAYFVDAGKCVTAFTGKYGETVALSIVSSADELAAALDGKTAPALGGYLFCNWSESADQAQTLFDTAVAGDGVIAVNAVYEVDTAKKDCAVTVTDAAAITVDGNYTSGDALSFDQRVTVTADGDVAYWLLDGAKVGFGASTFTFYVSGNNSISPVLTADAETELAPEVVLQQATFATNGTTFNLTVIAQTSIPAGYSVKSYGVCYTPTADALAKVIAGTAAEGEYLKVVSSKTAANQQYMTHLLNVRANRTRYAVAYAQLENGTIIYSDATVKFTVGTTDVAIVKEGM